MGWFDTMLAFLREPKAPVVKDEQPLQVDKLAAAESTGWASSSLLYAAGRYYNPDELVARKGHAIWNRMMLDEQVKAAVQFRRSSVTGRDWFFKLDHDKAKISEEEAKRRIDCYTHMLEDAYKGLFVDGLNAVMRALWQGHSFTEIMFAAFEFDDKAYWGLQKLRPKPYETFEVDVNDFGDELRWVQKRPGTAVERPVDMTKFVHYVNAPDIDEHYGQSELRSAYRWWFAKDFTIQFMNVFAERLAGGFVVCAPRDGQSAVVANSPEHNALKAILSNITGSTSMLLPAGYEVNVHYAPAGQSAVFEGIIGLQDLAIAKSLLIPNLLGMSNPKAQTGSFSQGTTQFDAFMVISDDDADRLADVLNEQVFVPLNKVNFEDGVGPRLCFKPLSEAKKMQLLQTWQGLVSAGGVEPSDTDEAHVRDLLDFPAKGEPLQQPADQVVDPLTGLPLDPAEAESPPDDNRSGKPPIGQPPRGRGRIESKDATESLQGRQVRAQYTRRAFARAERRVAFTVIGRQADKDHVYWRQRVEAALAELVAEGMARVEIEQLGSNPNTAQAVARFDLSGMKAQQLNTQVRRALQAGMDIGSDHARREIDLAKKERFSRKLNAERMGDLAADWLKAKSFTITGDLRAGAVKEIKQVLVNGLKFSWTQKEIKSNVYKALLQKGYLSGSSAAEALGLDSEAALAEELQVSSGLSAHRLDTVIRTNMFEAINEARFNAFTDPELDGYVQAFEYSSILDSRTTTICTHMDGRIYTAADWEGDLRPWVPPNHFNCRSLLVPITVDDELELTPERPTIEPQEGFG